MDTANVRVFGLQTINEYLEVAENAVSEFAADRTSHWKCIASFLILNHVPDWLDGKLTRAQRVALGWAPDNSTEAKTHFKNDDIELVRNVSNGMKHLRIKTQTETVSGYGAGPYGVGPYGRPYLIIDLGEEKSGMDRWVVADDLAKRVLEWWKSRLLVVV